MKGKSKGTSKNFSMSRSSRAKKNELRKNKEFMAVKRDIEDKERLARKKAKLGEITLDCYVDKDKAAALLCGGQDLAIDIRSKRKRDKVYNQSDDNREEELLLETYMLQGEHELKQGRPKVALIYFDKACEEVELDPPVPEPYLARSKCFIQLGEYAKAASDASLALLIDPFSLKSVFAKAYALYNIGAFEHSMMYFHRAHRMRPTKNEAKIGISQCKDAIMNGLGKYSKQVFWQMEKVLQCMIKKEEVNVLVEAITERLELGEIVGDSDMDIIEENKKNENENIPGKELPLKKLKELDLKHFDVKEKQSHLRIQESSVDFVDSMISRLEGASISNPSLVKKKTETKLRKANKALLGKLFDDQLYLTQLLNDPRLLQRRRGVRRDKAQKMILNTAEEGLKYLNSRKKFWQQQNPLYSRENELESAII